MITIELVTPEAGNVAQQQQQQQISGNGIVIDLPFDAAASQSKLDSVVGHIFNPAFSAENMWPYRLGTVSFYMTRGTYRFDPASLNSLLAGIQKVKKIDSPPSHPFLMRELRISIDRDSEELATSISLIMSGVGVYAASFKLVGLKESTLMGKLLSVRSTTLDQLQFFGASSLSKSLIVVHVSGSSGTGKTTLGKKIADETKGKGQAAVLVQDTDKFIQHHVLAGRLLIELEKRTAPGTPPDNEYMAAWRQILAYSLYMVYKAAVDQKKNAVVLVGLLDNWGGDNPPFELGKDVVKFYITIPMPLLLKQYYTRVVNGVDGPDEDFWKNLAEKRYHVSSSNQVIDGAQKLQSWHQAHGYTIIPRDEAPAKIISLLT
jgi:hypothetical protein